MIRQMTERMTDQKESWNNITNLILMSETKNNCFKISVVILKLYRVIFYDIVSVSVVERALNLNQDNVVLLTDQTDSFSSFLTRILCLDTP